MKTKKSLSPCVWSHREQLESRMTTPIVLLDSLGPKQRPKTIEWHVKPTTKFFYATQTQTLRLLRLHF